MNYNKQFLLLKAVVLIVFLFSITDSIYPQSPPSVIWSKIWGGQGLMDDNGYSCTSDGSGFLYVTGTTKSSTGNVDVITIKYSLSNGDTVWTRTYNGPANKEDDGLDCCLSGDGYLYVTGYSNLGLTDTDLQLLLLKYNVSNGTLVYAKYYGSSSGSPVPDETGYTCAYDGTNIYVSGMYYDGNNNLMKLWKFSPSGDTLWTRSISNANSDQFYGCAADNNGNVYATYYTRTGNVEKIGVVKFNSSGTLQWSKITGDAKDTTLSNNLTACSISGNSIFVTGLAGTTGDRYGITVKLSNSGDTLWTARNNSSSIYDQNHRCRADSQGNLYVCGTRYNGTNDDWTILKYNGLNGNLMWTVVYNYTGNNSDYAIDCALDNSGNLYATGFVNMNLGNSEIYTVKYQSTVGITPINGYVPDKFSLSQNYPNPFNPETSIQFSIKENAYTTLKVCDIRGCEIGSPVNGFLMPGIYAAKFDGSNLSSGVYFYTLKAGNFCETKKMLIIK